MLKKLCARCNKILEQGNRYCVECQARCDTYNKKRYRYYNKNKRDKDKQEFYNSKEWKYVSNLVKSKDFGLCQMCLSNEKIIPSDVVHHIIPLEENKSKSLELSNLICLCHSCHNKIHREMKLSELVKLEIQMKLFKIIEGRGGH